MSSLRYRCPVCCGVFELDADMTGGMVRCGHCGMQVNPSAVPQWEVMPGKAAAEGEAGGLAGARLRLLEQEAGLRALRRDGKPLVVRPAEQGRRRLGGRLLAAGVALVVAGVLCLVFGAPGAISFVAFAFGAIASILGSGLWLEERRVPSFAKRSTPAVGLRAFAAALGAGRFEYARCCLVPGNAVGQADFEAHWRPKIYPVQGTRHGVSHLKVKRQEGDLALVSCLLEITVRHGSATGPLVVIHLLMGHWLSLLAAKMAESEEGYSLLLTKLLRRIDGQWCVASPGETGPEDGAFEEAARVAGLSDAALAEELAACGMTETPAGD